MIFSMEDKMSIPPIESWPYQVEVKSTVPPGETWDPIAYAPDHATAGEIMNAIKRKWGLAIEWRIAERTSEAALKTRVRKKGRG